MDRISASQSSPTPLDRLAGTSGDGNAVRRDEAPSALEMAMGIRELIALDPERGKAFVEMAQSIIGDRLIRDVVEIAGTLGLELPEPRVASARPDVTDQVPDDEETGRIDLRG